MKLLGMRVWEDGESKCPTVMVGIGVISSTRKGAHFRLVLGHEITSRTTQMGAKQMTVTQVAGAAPNPEVGWHNIDWAKAHKEVGRLQARIVKAVKEGRWNKVKALQRLLTNSFSGKAIAVKRVTENQGRRTPGVDGKQWNTPADKPEALPAL